MAKRRKASKSKIQAKQAKQAKQNNISSITPSQWPEEDLVSLLAWKDYAIYNPSVDFKATIQQQLDDKYTDIEIQKKIRDLWCKCRVHARQHQRVFDENGTIALQTDHGLNYVPFEDITAALEKIIETAQKKSLVSTPRQLRTASVPDSTSVTSPIQSQERKRKYTGSITPTTVKGKGRTLQKSSAEQLSPTKKRRTEPEYKNPTTRGVEKQSKKATSRHSARPQRARVTRSSTLAPDTQTSLLRLQSAHSFKQERNRITSSLDIPDSTFSDALESSTDRDGNNNYTSGGNNYSEQEENTWVECRECALQQDSSDLKYICEECVASHNDSQRIESLLKQIEAEEKRNKAENLQLTSAVAEIAILREEIAERKNVNEKQKREIRELERIMSQLKDLGGDESDKNLLEKLKASIRKCETLREELKSRKRNSLFTNLRPTARERFGKTDIVNGFDEACSQSIQLLCRFEGENFPFVPQINQHETLMSLFSQTMKAGIPQQDDVIRLVSKLNPQVVVRVFSSLALQKWVFETEFPYFEGEKNDVLYTYRQQIAKQGKIAQLKAILLGLTWKDGPLTLRNLDLAVYSSLINEKSFRGEVIYRKASELAIRLSNALAPFFSDTPDISSELDWERFSTWREDEESWKERKLRLIEMFTGALLTKADSCLNVEGYQIVTYPPGTKFDDTIMIAETMEGMVDIVEDQDSRNVLICVQGGFFAYARNPITEKTNVQELLVGGNNFIDKEDKDGVDLRVLRKSVVILESLEK